MISHCYPFYSIARAVCLAASLLWQGTLLLGQFPGREQAVAVGPYLNRLFPTEVPGTVQGEARYTVENAFPNLTFVDPIKMLEMPGNRFMVVGKSGHVWMFDNQPNVSVKQTLLNLKSQVSIGVDGGMLGAVLHPEFGQPNSPNKGYFYLWYRYTPEKGSHGDFAYLRLSRFTFEEGKDQVNKSTEFVLIQQFDRHEWHNGGDMFFGQDGFLYISVGDEGGARDAFNVTQQIDKWLLSGVFRIDVDQQGGAISHPIRRQPRNQENPPSGWPDSFTQGYYIPNDNPWLDPGGKILEEFYAIGTRSPHRMTLDAETGDIWLGDVGQSSQEEISLVEKGDNLQWPYREGTRSGFRPKPNSLIGKDKPPIYTYGREEGASVIGGYVYRHNRFPELKGTYIFGDHETQNISLLSPDPDKQGGKVDFLVRIPTEGVSPKDGISSFALDKSGHVYILDLYGTDLDGAKIRKLVREGGQTADPPSRLSELEVFTDMKALTPASFMMPYEVNLPFWSDGALKKRWIILPNDGVYDSEDEQVNFSVNGNWKLPAGTVLVKHFDLPLDYRDSTKTQKLETRFFIYTPNGEAYGITYKWNKAGTEAFLLEEGEAETFVVVNEAGNTVDQTWVYPDREQCLTCHNANAGFALGLRTRQLNGEMGYPRTGRTAHQLETWEYLGMFAKSLPAPTHYARNAQLTQPATSLEFRVRSYLDANCAYCHQPGGVSGVFDARASTALFEQNLINAAGVSNSSPPGARMLVPGDPENSHIWIRNVSLGTNAMPPIAKNVVDEPYIEQLTQWIHSLDPGLPGNVDEGWYQLKPIGDEAFLGVDRESGTEGALVSSALSGHSASTKWFLQKRGARKYSLHAQHSHQALAYENMESIEGRNAVQEVFRTSQDQLWYIFGQGEDQYVIRNVYNGLYLGAGSSVSLWNQELDQAQRWRLVPLSTADLSACDVEAPQFLSEREWLGNAENGWGPVELDQSNGETEANDGRSLQINGIPYEKGLGVHAYSELNYALEGEFAYFLADIGVDDESCDLASVQFVIYGDDRLLYTSPLLQKGQRALSIEVPVSGVSVLKLVVNNGSPALAEDSKSCDHADWANARLITCPEVQDTPVSGEEVLASVFDVFPNPSLGDFLVSWDRSHIRDEVKVELYAMDGKRVYSTSIRTPGKIQPEGLVPGTYLLKITVAEKIQFKKLWLK